MWRRALLIPVLGLGLVACTPLASSPQSLTYRPAAFTHRVGTSHVQLYWSCARPEPDLLRIDGLIQNAYAPEVRYPEVKLVASNSEGRVVSEAQAKTEANVLRTNQVSPFRVDLRTTEKGLRLDLFYGPGGGSSRGIASAGIPLMVRDVCSETQHRNPVPAR